jgi:hypothetical protein
MSEKSVFICCRENQRKEIVQEYAGNILQP